MMLDLDPDLDLRIERIIHAPRPRVWKAWTDPLDLARWWLPAPSHCRVEQLDVVPGGAFVTSMSDDGIAFVPHLDACFVLVEPGERQRAGVETARLTCGLDTLGRGRPRGSTNDQRRFTNSAETSMGRNPIVSLMETM